MPGSFRLGRIAGIDIYVNFSWIIALALFTWSFAIGWFAVLYPGWSTATYWLTGFIASVLLFGSVVLHELGHSLVARAHSIPVKNIVLFIFGGVSNIQQEPKSPGVEFQVSVIGPVISLVIGGICLLLSFALRGSSLQQLDALLWALGVSNLLLGVLNLIPGFPLDGGRVLRSIVWRVTGSLSRATRVAAAVGQLFAYLFILFGIFLFFTNDFLNGIWFGFIGWFLLSAAQSSNSQVMLQSMFRGVLVRDVMNPHPTTVPANISLQRLVDEYFLPAGLRYALVMQGDQLAGLITLVDIRHVPREEWGQTPVGHAMIPLERLHVITPDQSLNDVLPLMAGQDVNQLPVMQDDRLVGILSRDAIVRFVEIRRGLGVDTARRGSAQDREKDSLPV